MRHKHTRSNPLKKSFLPLLGGVSMLAAACAPSISYEGQLIEVVRAKDTVQCKHLGNNRITLQRIYSFSNNPEKQSEALLAEARNLAAEIGADTVAPIGEIENKQQVFKFYICNPDNY